MISKIKNEWLNYLNISIALIIPFSIIFSQKFPDFLVTILMLPIFYFGVLIFNDFGQKISNNSFIIFEFIVSFIIRLISIFIIERVLKYYIGIPFLSFKDDYEYHEVAIQIAERWKLSGIGLYSDIPYSIGVYSGFPNFSAFLMMLFGNNYYVPRIGNAIISSFTCIVIFQIIKKVSSIQLAKEISIIFTLSPLLFTIAAFELKDTLLLFFCILAIDGIIGILKKIKVSWLKLSFSIFVMLFIRPAAIIPIIIPFILLLIYLTIKNKSIKRMGDLIILFVSLMIISNYIVSIFYINLFGDNTSYFTSRFIAMTTRTVAKNTRAAIATTNLAKYVGAPLYLIFSIFLPVPLIVNLANAETINYSAYGLLFHVSLLPFLVNALISAIRNRNNNLYQFYIALVFICFKIGQSFSLMSILSARQSLSSLFVMYLLLPSYTNDALNKKSRMIIYITSIIIMYTFSIVRLYVRSINI
jgi:hypothetical protein